MFEAESRELQTDETSRLRSKNKFVSVMVSSYEFISSSFSGYPKRLILYTNDEPLLESKGGQSYLKAINAICPQNENIAVENYVREVGCAWGIANFEISTPRSITVVTQNQG